MTKINPSDYKTVQNYAIKKGVHRVQVFRMIHRKEVEAIKIDGKWFVKDI